MALMLTPRRLAALALIIFISACHAPEAEVVPRTAPTKEPPKTLRVELVETASVATSSTSAESEIWVPLASSEPNGQTIEAELIRISPDSPSEIENDSHGNRILHVKSKDGRALEVSVTYHVELVEHTWTVPAIASEPALSPGERGAFAPELAPTNPTPPEHDDDVYASRRRGIPARWVSGLRIDKDKSESSRDVWSEFYYSGTGWVPSIGSGLMSGFMSKDVTTRRPENLLALTKGLRSDEPWVTAKPDSAVAKATWRVRDMPEH